MMSIDETLFCRRDIRAHVPHDRRDDRADACLHPGQHPADHGVVPEQLIEIGDERDDDERWDDGGDGRGECPGQPCELVAHDDRAVDRDGAGGGLRDGDKIEHLVLADPVPLVHEPLFHQRDDHIAPAEGERAEIQRGKKQLGAETLFFFMQSFLSASQYIASGGRSKTGSAKKSRTEGSGRDAFDVLRSAPRRRR